MRLSTSQLPTNKLKITFLKDSFQQPAYRSVGPSKVSKVKKWKFLYSRCFPKEFPPCSNFYSIWVCYQFARKSYTRLGYWQNQRAVFCFEIKTKPNFNQFLLKGSSISSEASSLIFRLPVISTLALYFATKSPEKVFIFFCYLSLGTFESIFLSGRG